MTNFLYNTICIKAQDETELSERIRDLLIDANGDFTFDKIRPVTEFDDFVADSSEIEVTGNSLIFSIETPGDSHHIWFRNLSVTYPELLIECEYHCLADEEFGSFIWLNGELVHSSQENSFSRERFVYFGGDVDEVEGWFYTEFEAEENKQAVDVIQAAIEAKSWVALMDALFTARHQLEYFANPHLDEDTLRVAIVANDAALTLMRVVLTDPEVDFGPIAEVIGCKPESLEEWEDEGFEPEEPATRDDLLELLETMAVETARLLSLSTLHYTTREITSVKDRTK